MLKFKVSDICPLAGVGREGKLFRWGQRKKMKNGIMIHNQFD